MSLRYVSTRCVEPAFSDALRPTVIDDSCAGDRTRAQPAGVGRGPSPDSVRRDGLGASDLMQRQIGRRQIGRCLRSQLFAARSVPSFGSRFSIVSATRGSGSKPSSGTMCSNSASTRANRWAAASTSSATSRVASRSRRRTPTASCASRLTR